ncbi:MAG: hypothetical protein HY060_05625 [Proteobacteria bacterium]|nr:hypothetical protein [Pseudomonadota bacterium]
MDLAKCSGSFADFLAPVTVEQFRRDYLDRAPLHIPGNADTFADVMSWRELNRLLDMTGIWTSRSLSLSLDCRAIPEQDYCRSGRDRDGRPAMLPDPVRVRRLVRQGASLLLNDIDTLSPGLRAVADLLERTLGGKVQINLYCSWRERQAFPSHFDTHDVFALHIAGAKRWTVYRGRADQPVDHPAWKTLGQAHHDRARGEILTAADLVPGDILYLPRGQYHDALATDDTAIHLAVGVNEPIGLDVLSLLFEDAVAGADLFRRRLPPVDQAGAVADHPAALAARLGARPGEPDFQTKLATLRTTMRYRRGGFPPLPGLRAGPVKTFSGN